MSEESLSIPSLHSSLAISDNTTTMSKAPQDSQATIPFDPQEEQEFSCGQQISSSNPESVVSDDDKDQLSDDSDGEWTGLELPDISPASEPTTVTAEGSSQHGELSQTFNSSQTAKRRRESETVDLVSVEDPALPMPLFLQSQYQRTATHVMALTDRIARLETGSQAYSAPRNPFNVSIISTFLHADAISHGQCPLLFTNILFYDIETTK